MTIVEETIRMPAWRSASPKKRKTCRPKTSPRMRPQNFDDLAEGREPVAWDAEPAAAHDDRRPPQRMTLISGCVASSVCVNT